MPNKLGDPAGCHYLVTTVTFYYSAVTDLTLSRSVHATELEPCCPDPFLLSSEDCRAIHYGQCSSLLKLPTFAIVPPTCTIGKKVDQRVLPRQDENALNFPLEANSISPSSSSESLEKTCSSLDTLAANIEQNIKPFLSILSSYETTDSSTANPEESIGNLATSLQYHLGNFIAAVRQQQQLLKDDFQGEELLKESISSSDVQKKKPDLPAKLASLNYNDLNCVNGNILAENDRTSDRVSSNAHNSAAIQQKKSNVYDDLTGDKRVRPLDSCATKGQFPNKVSNRGSPEITQVLSTEASLAKQREVMRILNKKEPVKNNLCGNNDSVDSELLDSLISLMNVSLVDLEENSQKKNHFQKGEVYSSTSKSLHRPEVRVRDNILEDRISRDNDVSGSDKVRKLVTEEVQPHPPCRRKLVFNVEGSCESDTFPKANDKPVGTSGKQDTGNGELDGVPRETLKSGEWSIAYYHRRDSLAPILPTPSEAKRPHSGSKNPSALDLSHIISTAKSSVAERVLAFEKCPDWNIERTSDGKDFSRKTSKERDLLPALPKKVKRSSRPVFAENSVVQFVRRPSQIPKFYFPNGPPPISEDLFEGQLENVKRVFSVSKGKVTYEGFDIVTKACSLPLYWKMPLYLAVGTDKMNNVSTNRFVEYWRRMANTYFDEPSRFVYILSRGKRSFLLPEDFRPMIQDIVDSHPGLSFLRDSKEFHSRYIDTVISRIFFDVNRSWSGKITALELRKSNFLQAVADLEEDDDINQMTDYFSYEHFYVIYCKFWKIDTDHDLLIDSYDLSRHNGGDISSRMIDRIFSGAVSREILKTGHMRYTDFVWFLLAEEDKRHPRSIEYWFRCMDLNGDGFLSMYELEYFYEEQARRMEAAGIEAMPFKDCLCQMLDMVRPSTPEKISLSDLKQCKLTTLFFDTFFNLGKYLEHEQRDPFASVKIVGNQGTELSDWCRYAEEEYGRLISEENYGYSDTYQGSGQYYCAENALYAKPEFESKMYIKNSERDDDDDYADSDADY